MSIAQNLAEVQQAVDRACRRAGRDPSEVTLMAVSKVHPVACLLEAYAAGQRVFGENRVQEWQAKRDATTSLPGLETHLIGPLQSNKSTRAVELFAAIDTVDSLRLARRLNDAAKALGRRLPIHIEVKLSPEASKHGLPPGDLPEMLAGLHELTALLPLGLMTVPPWPRDVSQAGEEARPYFRELRRLRDQSLQACPTLTGLSMGMSNDFTAAIEEGSTCIRVGTAIFGARPKTGTV